MYLNEKKVLIKHITRNERIENKELPQTKQPVG